MSSLISILRRWLERKPLIGGRDLMAVGIPPGPGVGKILEAARAVQDEKAVPSWDEALTLAAELNRGSG
jgi:hypothetical protein